MNKQFDYNYKYFIKNKDKFQKQYPNKVLLIVNQQVIKSYDTEIDAYKEALKKYKLGEFMCQLVDYDKPKHIVYLTNL